MPPTAVSAPNRFTRPSTSIIAASVRVTAQLDASFRDISVGTGANQTVGPASARYHVFDTSTGTPSIDTINDNETDGWKTVFRWDGDATSLTLNDGLGNLSLAGNFAFNDANDTIVLVWNEQNSLWIEASRSNN